MHLNRLIYAWLAPTKDGHLGFRSKVKYVNEEDQPDWWQYDGSSTGQATSSSNTEVYLKPVKQYIMPNFTEDIRQTLVLCETYLPDKVTPHPDNKRYNCCLTMAESNVVSADPWYGFELEFFIMDAKTRLPLGFKPGEAPPAQGQFYCSVGAGNCYGRDIMDEFEALCHKCGVGLVGSNAEVSCGQWEYQIFGKGLKAADDAWASRYFLDLVAEKHGAYISWHPKPFAECNGSGMHVNFSTVDMRDPKKGHKAINNCIHLLSSRHEDHIRVYGAHNNLRLTGKHETSSMELFTCDVGTRGTSVRINHDTAKNWHGYIEDRRPASSCDMYSVVQVMADTVILMKKHVILEEDEDDDNNDDDAPK